MPEIPLSRNHGVGASLTLSGVFDTCLELLLEVAGRRLKGRSSRVAERFALIATAGSIASIAGLTGWEESEAMCAAAQAFQSWLDLHDDDDAAKIEIALECIREFKNRHADDIQDLADLATTPSLTAKAWLEGDVLFIPSDSWQSIFPGDDAAKTGARLRDAGALLPGDGKNLMKKAPRVYALSLRRMGISFGSGADGPMNTSAGPLEEIA